ncbi:MAG: preprotein translocase subunit SecY [Candidatus Kapaibacterium sp.]|nr:preprotein translocase subunit SecY [Ignavibacteriota bacterium]MCB9221139.1 preprotein translocase subunit SecY [Ignavibacteria bacterium]
MAKFGETFSNIFKIEELRNRIFFTLLILLVVRVGAFITIPGIDVDVLKSTIGSGGADDLFGFFDLFVGGAFSNAAIFALGIMPYITSSIIFQLAGVVFPQIQKMQKEGEDGRRKINQWTRFATVFVAGLQSIGVAVKLVNQTAANGAPVVPDAGVLFFLSTVITLTAGTIFLMWLGEQITERGVGNGISLIIFIGIIAALPAALLQEWELISVGSRPWFLEIIIFAFLFGIIASIVLITQGARRIPVQYAKRQVGKRVFGGTTQFIPLRVNTAGVMPIIFAQSLMFIPNTIASFFPNVPAMQSFAAWFNPSSFGYAFVYGIMVVLFTFFYTAIIFNPKEIADNMKRQGGFVPGIRPGAPTAEYIERILTRITLPGSIFLALIAILPTFVQNIFGITSLFASFFGGTSLIIIVGVGLDTLQQIESHLMMRHYDGFMKTGKMKGRAGIGGF